MVQPVVPAESQVCNFTLAMAVGIVVRKDLAQMELVHFLKVLTLGRHYTYANHLTTCRLQLMATMAHFLRSAFGCRRSTCPKKEIHNLFFSCADCCARDSLYI